MCVFVCVRVRVGCARGGLGDVCVCRGVWGRGVGFGVWAEVVVVGVKGARGTPTAPAL